MKDLKSILKECSIKEIYCDNHGAPITYVIPIYQRNYAWERDEICALIKDVHDSMDMGKTVYYIGTLVTYKRDENKYEVIDGQQRLTSLFLLLRAIYSHLINSDEQNDKTEHFIKLIQPTIWRTDKLTGKVDYKSTLLTSRVVNNSDNEILRLILETRKKK